MNRYAFIEQKDEVPKKEWIEVGHRYVMKPKINLGYPVPKDIIITSEEFKDKNLWYGAKDTFDKDDSDQSAEKYEFLDLEILKYYERKL